MIFLLFILLSTPQEDFNFAVGLYNDGLYELAREEFLRFLKNYPQSNLCEDAKYYSALCLYKLKKYDKAVKEIENFLKVYPRSKFVKEAKLNLAKCYFYLGDFEKSLKIFKEVEKYYPEDVNYWLAEAYFKNKDFKSAIKYYKKLQKGKYKDYAVYSTGYCYFKLSQYDSAVKYLKEVKEDKYKLEAEVMLASSYYAMGKYKEALDLLSKIEEKAEKYPQIKMMIADCYQKIGNYEKAIEKYQKLEEAEKWIRIGDCYYKMKKLKSAIDSYKKAVEENEELKPIAYEKIGKLYFEIKDYGKAVEYFDKSGTDEARLYSAHACFNKGDYDGAIKRYKEIYDEKKDENLLYYIALSYYKKGELDSAEEYIKKYSKDDERKYFLLAEINYKKGNYKEALKDYEIASKSKEFEGKALMGKMYCLTKLGDYAEAYKVGKILVDKYPSEEAFFEFGNICYLQKKYDEAIKWYSKCKGAIPLYRIGEIYFNLGKYWYCIRSFRNFIKHYPLHEKASEAKYLIGMAYRHLGKYEKSIKEMNELIDNYPDSKYIYEARCVIGDNYFDMKKYSEAELAYREALRVFGVKYPDRAIRAIGGLLEARYYSAGKGSFKKLAQSYIDRFKGEKLCDLICAKAGDIAYNQGEYKIAVEFYKQSETPYCMYWLSKTYLKLDKKEDAEKILKKLIEKYSETNYAKKARYEMGILYFERGEYDKALSLFEKIDFGDSKIYLAKCYWKKGEILKAEAILNEVIKKRKDLKEKAQLVLGDIYLEQGNYKMAITLFGQIEDVTLKPEAQYKIGEAYFKSGNYKEAMRAYLKVKYIRESKWISPALFKAAQCAEKLGKKEEAKRLYKMVVDRGDRKDLVKEAKKHLR